MLPQPPRSVIVAGGGARNRTLMRMLAERLAPATVETAEAVGWSADALEAQAFAFLAARHLRGLPITFPGTTGVPRAMTGGVMASRRALMLHFAYGSNMHRGADAGGGVRMPAWSAARCCAITVCDHTRRLRLGDGGARRLVHGLLWRYSPRDLAALNAYENIDAGLFRAAAFGAGAGRRLQKLLSISAAAGLPAGRGRGIWSSSRRPHARPGFPPIMSPVSSAPGFAGTRPPSRRTE